LTSSSRLPACPPAFRLSRLRSSARLLAVVAVEAAAGEERESSENGAQHRQPPSAHCDHPLFVWT
jgi:hypothetical protein